MLSFSDLTFLRQLLALHTEFSYSLILLDPLIRVKKSWYRLLLQICKISNRLDEFSSQKFLPEPALMH